MSLQAAVIAIAFSLDVLWCAWAWHTVGTWPARGAWRLLLIAWSAAQALTLAILGGLIDLPVPAREITLTAGAAWHGIILPVTLVAIALSLVGRAAWNRLRPSGAVARDGPAIGRRRPVS